MKMTKEHYDVLKKKVEALLPGIENQRTRISLDPTVKDPSKRLLWDTFHAANIFAEYTYQQFDYLDDHIETAMRSIFKELNVRL